LSLAAIQIHEIRPSLNLVKAPTVVETTIIPAGKRESSTQTELDVKYPMVKTSVIADIKPSYTRSCGTQIKIEDEETLVATEPERNVPLVALNIGALYRFPENHPCNRLFLPEELRESTAFEKYLWAKQVYNANSAVDDVIRQEYDQPWLFLRVKFKNDIFKVLRVKLYCNMNAILDKRQSFKKFRDLVGSGMSTSKAITLCLQVCNKNGSYDVQAYSTTAWIKCQFLRTFPKFSGKHYDLGLRFSGENDDYPQEADLQLDEETSNQILGDARSIFTETDDSPNIKVEGF